MRNCKCKKIRYNHEDLVEFILIRLVVAFIGNTLF